ncbi:hypothetical protein VTN00DRAFT_2047 [Thermoascus crustaceus]|uniref:uncharacterized protein n=1 Tax=Thermoascus crustaceus TaxID=5088 RepID=UPI0037440420
MSSLQDHIALHLERFALFSLPRAVDEEDKNEDGGSDKANVALESSRDGDFNYSLDVRGESDPTTSASSVAQQRWQMGLYEVRSKLILERLIRRREETGKSKRSQRKNRSKPVKEDHYMLHPGHHFDMTRKGNLR